MPELNLAEVVRLVEAGEYRSALSTQVDNGRGRATPEDGADLLDEILDMLTRYVIFPSEDAAIAYTLWLTATHAQPAWEHATRFVLESPIKRCGKTRAQEIGRELAHRPLSTVNISVAALVRSIDENDPPTLFIDEADTIFGKKKDQREGAEDLRGILNSGHSRGWPYVRWDMKARQAEECPTFAMALVAGIGTVPDTIEDRGIVIQMRRRAPGEHVAAFRQRRVVPQLHALRDRLRAWVSALEGLEDAEPDLPVEDRDADKWEALVAIADAAGGEWPERARAACAAMCGQVSREQDTAGERLLADLAGAWDDDEPQLHTAKLLERLHAIEEAPWADWYGKPLSARALARLLSPFGVSSRNIRSAGGVQAKGYVRADFEDAWTRYTYSSVPSVPPSQAASAPRTQRDGSGTDSEIPFRPIAQQGETPVGTAGTDGTDTSAERVTDDDLGALCHDDEIIP